MNIAGHDIGVCSWSLGPMETPELIKAVRELGLSHMQLWLRNLTLADDKRKAAEMSVLRSSGITITAGMISFPGEDYSTIAAIRKTGGYVSEQEFPIRRQLTKAAARVAKELGLAKLSTHIGFVPPSSDPHYQAMVKRVTDVAGDLNEFGITLLLETGQETAPELLQFLNDLSCNNVQVNFDPANMILYGAGDPIEAIGILGRHIGHVHVKDAKISGAPGKDWGAEVPFGEGEVPPRDFLQALKDANYTGPLVIEREAGDTRMKDIATAIKTLRDAAA